MSDFPPIVYKYRQWDDPNHVNALTLNEIYFASPADFNDPFDCQITENFSLLDTEEKIRNYTDRVLINTRDNWLDGSVNVVKKMIEFEGRLANRIQFQAEFDSYTIEQQNLHYGVLCLSTEHDNILLWSHYANKHRGFCIGYAEPALRVSLVENGKGGPVIYDQNYPQIDPLDSDQIKKMFLSTHFKSQVWSYEKEYRISKLFYPKIPSKTDRQIHLPNSAFVDVTLGLFMSDKHKLEVTNICKSKGIPVFQAKKIQYDFKLDRFQIA